MTTKEIKVGIVDDHQLFLSSVSLLIRSFPTFRVVIEAVNGDILLKQLPAAKEMPDILLMDVNMPVLNGYETTLKVLERHPDIKVVALSMKDDDLSIINMIKAGCCAYLLKGIHQNELERALLDINNFGYYNSDISSHRLRKIMLKQQTEVKLHFTDRELTFLQLACSDSTYKEIAAKMFLSERTIDGYRESLFEKLNVQSRVGMVLEALRREIVQLK